MSLLIGILVLQPLRHMMDARTKAKPMRHHSYPVDGSTVDNVCFRDSRDPSLFKNVEVSVGTFSTGKHQGSKRCMLYSFHPFPFFIATFLLLFVEFVAGRDCRRLVRRSIWIEYSYVTVLPN